VLSQKEGLEGRS
jgi:hypothetical protein